MSVLEAHRGDGPIPSAREARELARSLLGTVGTRLDHVLSAAEVAAEIAPLVVPRETELVVAAATLHDIGYAPQIARTGFHPIDGANHLRHLGFSMRLASLVAHHSHAEVTAPDHGIEHLSLLFPPEDQLLCDVLCYSDMHASPNGGRISVDERLADIRTRHQASHTAARLRLVRESVERVCALLAAPADRAAAAEPLPHRPGQRRRSLSL